MKRWNSKRLRMKQVDIPHLDSIHGASPPFVDPRSRISAPFFPPPVRPQPGNRHPNRRSPKSPRLDSLDMDSPSLDSPYQDSPYLDSPGLKISYRDYSHPTIQRLHHSPKDSPHQGSTRLTIPRAGSGSPTLPHLASIRATIQQPGNIRHTAIPHPVNTPLDTLLPINTLRVIRHPNRTHATNLHQHQKPKRRGTLANWQST